MASPTAAERLGDRRRRLENLYWIRDKAGIKVRFRMNRAQAALFDGMHHLNLILKARQLGFTTFLQLYMLDACLFNSDTNAGTIAHTLDDAIEIFDHKIKFAYDALPEGLKAARPARRDSARKLAFANGSSIRVGTSLRSGTYQYLHISEFGKICATAPAKAREIRTGALNTVQAGQVIWIESTAEGQDGDFYALVSQARRRAAEGRRLTPMDFKFFFFPWHRDPDYRLEAHGVEIAPAMERYFESLAADHGIRLDAAQRAWYAKKAESQGDDMGREYPSVPDEAFAAAVEGSYFAAAMARARREGRIGRVPFEPTVPVHTFWDLGIDDETAIWFHQRVGLENRFIGYLADAGEGLAHYAGELRRLQDRHGWLYGTHHLPHDVEARSLSTGRTRRATLEGLGVRPIRTVPRATNIADDIEAVRGAIASCWFDAAGCADGIKALDNYRREFDAKLGTFKNRPRHDWASHGADAFRTFAVGFRPPATARRWATAVIDADPI